MSEQKFARPVVTTEALLQSIYASSAYAAHVVMDEYFRSHTAPRQPIIHAAPPAPHPEQAIILPHAA